MGFSYSTILASKGGKTPVSAATATAGAISPSVAPTTGVIEDEFVNNIAPGGNPPTPAQAAVPTATVTATIPSVEPVTSVIEDEIIVNDIAPESSKIVVSSLRMRATVTVVSVMVPRPSAWS
uniref:Uncharacterized protein n=1 Tax=Opuntia streptacantha TaxID=393608 RepID=A0A7C9CX94_OPUST